jgi:MFS transporter, putative metabolite transport protein
LKVQYKGDEIVADSYTLDTAPFNNFHKRIVAVTTGGMLCDGYILGMIGIALAVLTPQMQISPVWVGLIASSALIGVFIGGIIFGWLSDRVGRQTVFLGTLIIFVIGSILQFFVVDPMQLFVLRLVIGIAIGAEYAVGTPLLAEFLPRKNRGPLLATLSTFWFVGSVIAACVGYIMQQFGSDEVWRWMLASSAAPSIIVLLMRIGMPESPRWLITQGRVEEAKLIVEKYIGSNVTLNDISVISDTNKRANYRDLFKKGIRKRTAYGGIYWLLRSTPSYALVTFAPQILSSLNVKNPFFGTLLTNLIMVVGAITLLFVVDKVPRRKFVIYTFGISAVPLMILGFWPDSPILVIALAVGFTYFFNTFSSGLEYVYPNELFPTELRASGVGLSAAISRLGIASGTFLFPIINANLGISYSLLIGAGLFILGSIISVAWAPETLNKSLDQITYDEDVSHTNAKFKMQIKSSKNS